MDKKTAKKIAARNDELRRRIYFPPEGDRVRLAPSIERNPDPVLQAVRDFRDFRSDDDPEGTHQQAILVVDETKFQFCIQYWNHDLTEFDVDPLDEGTRRIISIKPIL